MRDPRTILFPLLLIVITHWTALRQTSARNRWVFGLLLAVALVIWWTGVPTEAEDRPAVWLMRILAPWNPLPRGGG